MHRSFLIVAALALLAAASPRDPPQELPGLHNVHKATDTVYVGSEPHGEEGFASLRELGITTILSVDGAKPDVATAEKFGIRYIHIPMGYDGIPEHAAKSLTRVAREIQSPLYVHCHHGKHRGPAAAAVLCIAAGSLNHKQAIKLMTDSGTSKDYSGLWRDVLNFIPSKKDTALPELVAVAKVESIAAAMARIDRSFDNLKLCAKTDWMTPVDHPDLVPATEALLVEEGLHECGRHLTEHQSKQFRKWLSESDALANELYVAVKAGDAAAAGTKLLDLEQKCIACHAEYRNQ